MTALPVRCLCVAALLVGVALQFVQQTDPTFPLAYFTIDSTLFAGLLLGAGLIARDLDRWPLLRGSATLGVVMSGVVYALVIAPASSTSGWIQAGDD